MCVYMHGHECVCVWNSKQMQVPIWSCTTRLGVGLTLFDVTFRATFSAVSCWLTSCLRRGPQCYVCLTTSLVSLRSSINTTASGQWRRRREHNSVAGERVRSPLVVNKVDTVQRGSYMCVWTVRRYYLNLVMWQADHRSLVSKFGWMW